MQVFACFFVHRDTETRRFILTMTMTMTMTLTVASLPWKHRKNGIYARSLRHSYIVSMAFIQCLKILQARCGWIRL